MTIVLFDDPNFRENLMPVTLTRPIADMRIGIYRIIEKWEKRLKLKATFLTESYLMSKFGEGLQGDLLYINASFLPNEDLCAAIQNLELGSQLSFGQELIACRSSTELAYPLSNNTLENTEYRGQVAILSALPHLYLLNANEIKSDCELLENKNNSIVDPHVVMYGKENIFIGKNVNIKACILNAENGPIHIADDAILQEGSIIIGPVSIGNHSMVAFGAKIRPNTSLGPYCRVGGEVGNSIFHGYSNKAHDGFLGNSYIGEWCNLGANTNNSNLKNDYQEVKLHSYASGALESSGEVFCGTFMGDFTKTGISTMLNTGTVIGVCANVYGAGFQDKYVPSFTWGGKTESYQPYRFDKAIEVINATMSRKQKALNDQDIAILRHIQIEGK